MKKKHSAHSDQNLKNPGEFEQNLEENSNLVNAKTKNYHAIVNLK